VSRPLGRIFTSPPASISQLLEAIGQFVSNAPLTRGIGPLAVLVDTSPVLLADCTDVSERGSLVVVGNLGPNTIFWGLSNSAKTKPSLTTTNGMPLAANAVHFFDNIGGQALWAVCTVLQVAGAETRVSGAKV